MKTLKDFTPEIKAKIPEYIKRYTNGVFDGGRYNAFKKENSVELINWNYEKCNFKKPVVIVAENPLEMQYFFNFICENKEQFLPIIYLNYCLINKIEIPDGFLKAGQLRGRLAGRLAGQLDDQLDGQLRGRLAGQLDDQLRGQLAGQLYGQLDGQLRGQLRDQLDDQLRGQLDGRLRGRLAGQLDDQLDDQLRGRLAGQLDGQLRGRLYGQLYGRLAGQLDDQLDDQLRGQLRGRLYGQLYGQLAGQLDDQLRDQLDDQLRDQLDDQLRGHLKKISKVNNYGLFSVDSWWGGSAAFYKFIKDELKVEAEINVTLDSWNNLYEKSGIYTAIFSELICVVSKYPKKVYRNENNDLHSVDGSAIEWGNSTEISKWSGFYVNGRNIHENYFNAIKENKFTAETFFKEKNEEIKSACIAMLQELYGDDKIFNLFKENLKEIDSFVDKKDSKYLDGTTKGMNIGVYHLFKGDINATEIAYVRCYCPSTDRMFYLGVDNSHTKAKDAIASLYRVPSKLKTHIKSISRQGERFCTTFTDKGNEILSGLTEQEISNVKGINGNEYFSLMTYEF